jgi:hypothetical protein
LGTIAGLGGLGHTRKAENSERESGKRADMVAVNEIVGERRRSRRFLIKCKVQCRIAGEEVGTGTVDGETINISSSGLLFTSKGRLKLGRRIELAISWPALLNHDCPLKLVARGRVVRNDEGCGAIEIERHEFRTAAIGRADKSLPGPAR